jgi:hypothetical protein
MAARDPRLAPGSIAVPLGTGIGLRPPHHAHILENRPPVPWFEAIAENFMGMGGGSSPASGPGGGRPLETLERIRETYPVVLHGVSLSIGSVDPLDGDHLKRLRALADRIRPAWVSDHLCWTGVHGENLHDLLPLPYTREAARHVAARVREVQDHLGRRILLENVSSYLTYSTSEMTEWEFLSEIAREADCGLLLDVNNVFVSSFNHGFDPLRFLDGVPAARVGQFHLAGYSELEKHLLDTHDHPVSEPVWKLYEAAVRRFGPVPTLIEWDDRIPEFAVLEAEARRAREIQEKVLGKEPRPSHARRAPELAALDHH